MWYCKPKGTVKIMEEYNQEVQVFEIRVIAKNNLKKTDNDCYILLALVNYDSRRNTKQVLT